MNTLKLEMENCYGIQKIQQDIDFSKNNVAVIYAPNGTMKSSFAKTFEAIRDGKTVEEKVYGCKSKYSITDETSTAISPESIMVINPFDENAYENQGTLMANETLRRQYIQIYKSIDQSREAMFGKIKASLKYSSRSSFDAESSMLNDWGYTKKDLFLCLKEIENKLNNSELQCSLKEEELDYNTLFNSKVYSMVTSGKTSELIEEYEKKYSELLEKSLYMQKGVIDHNNYANISDSLGNNGFFGAKNEIRLVANKDNIVVASIPFVRNLIEYTEGDSNPEYLKLTSLLHYKPDTTTIELGEIEKIYNQYWCKSSNVNFAKNRETDHIYDIIIKEADAIVPVEKLEIESKLILSMAIRLKSDEYMIQKISSKVTNGTAIINDIYQKRENVKLFL